MSRTYGRLELDKARNVWVMNDIEPHVAIKLKQLFPRIRKTDTENFTFPNDSAHAVELDWFCSRYALRISDADRILLTSGRQLFETSMAEMERILMPDYKAGQYLGMREGKEIRQYQAQAIDLLLLRKSLLLGDDGGLGKTISTAGFLLDPSALPGAVLMQTHLQGQWMEMLTKFTTLRVHPILGTKPYSLPPADVYLFKYSQGQGWVDIFDSGFFKSVTFDEVQELRRGTESEKGRAAKKLAEKAIYRLGLSGTPVINYGIEIFNIMQFIAPGVLGERDEFLREWHSSGKAVADPIALGTFLREQHVFLRRTKKDVGQFMPSINRIIETVDTDEKELEKIKDLASALALKVMTGQYFERGQAARELDLMARHATGVAKAKSVAAYVRILLEAGVPVLLMGWHRDVYEIWLSELGDFQPVMYTGTESPAEKKRSLDAFIDGRSPLLIMSLRSGAGIDGLQQRCSTVVFGELDWSQKLHEQIIWRLDREGQKDPVTAIYLNSDDGSDPPMIELLGVKASQASGITDPDAVFEPQESDDSRVKALARRYLDKRGIKAVAEYEKTREAVTDVEPRPVAEPAPKQSAMEF